MIELNEAVQQRSHARVEDLLPLSWRRIEADEHAEIRAVFEQKGVLPPRQGENVHQLLAALDVGNNLTRLEKENPDLAYVLGRMDVKLNLLLQLAYPATEAHPFLPTRVNLGGGGLAFWGDPAPFVRGQFLEIRLALSVGALAIVDFFVQVVEVGRPGLDNLAKIACRFDPVTEDVREQIIQHVFKRQALILRAKHTKTQEMP